ncbi:MAG: dual specificity protein phosphatase family protein [bacterium]
MRKRYYFIIYLLIFQTITINVAFGETMETQTSLSSDRPKHWAVPLNQAGLPNFNKVTEDLYRGAQPTAEGIVALKKLGIRTIVNLRSFHTDKDEIGSTEIAYEHIYMKTWHPEKEDIIRFIRIVIDKTRIPVFVHCQHGADRTGTMCAIYRIVISGWTKEEAIKEMTQGGFGFHKIWANLIDFINNLDIETIRQELSLKKE